jgi:hypothetical protein
MILADQESGHHITSEKEPPNAPGAGSAPDGGVRAWLVAAGAASVFLCTLGLANSFGTFEEYYLTHQLKGNTASAISWIGSLQSFLQFFSGMLGGPLFDRFGAKVRWLPPLNGLVIALTERGNRSSGPPPLPTSSP